MCDKIGKMLIVQKPLKFCEMTVCTHIDPSLVNQRHLESLSPILNELAREMGQVRKFNTY